MKIPPVLNTGHEWGTEKNRKNKLKFCKLDLGVLEVLQAKKIKVAVLVLVLKFN